MHGLIKTGYVGSYFLLVSDVLIFISVIILQSFGILYGIALLLTLPHFILIGLGFIGIFRTYKYVGGYQTFLFFGIIFLAYIPISIYTALIQIF
jgi:hypothetical protein